jgi:biopolymer transport protein ExbD
VNLRKAKFEDPIVDVAPLIDVVFLLLIFFMVSTTFNRESQIEVTLPEAAINAPAKDKFTIEVTVNAQGTYFVNGQRVINTQTATLKQAMLKVAGGRQDPPIIVDADANTTHQSVVRVMDAARQLGFVHLSFATTETPQSQ